MAVLSGSVSGNRAPDNVVSGDYTVTTTTYACGNSVQPIPLDNTLGMTAGRWVVVRASVAITGYVGANVTPPSGLSVYGVSREPVSFSGTTYDCVVVTLV